MVAKRLLLFCILLLAAHGCGQPSAPSDPAPSPVAEPRPTPALPTPDPAQWVGKSLDAALAEHLANSKAFAEALRRVQSDGDVAAQKSVILSAAQALRLTRFALVDISRAAPLSADQRKAVDDVGAAVAAEVARLIQLPAAKESLHEAFLLVRTAPALKP